MADIALSGFEPILVNNLLEKTVVEQEMKHKVSPIVQAMAHRQVFEEVLVQANIPWGSNRSEEVNALGNTIFLKGSELHADNPVKISGKRFRLPPKNEDRSLFDSFHLINRPELIQPFVELCCKQDEEGNPIVNDDGEYELDHGKYNHITARFEISDSIGSQVEPKALGGPALNQDKFIAPVVKQVEHAKSSTRKNSPQRK